MDMSLKQITEYFMSQMEENSHYFVTLLGKILTLVDKCRFNLAV